MIQALPCCANALPTGELGGCGVGMAGAAILSMSAGGGGHSSNIGDAAALLGAAANGMSLSIGRLLLLAPYHVPVFTYSCVVTGGRYCLSSPLLRNYVGR